MTLTTAKPHSNERADTIRTMLSYYNEARTETKNAGAATGTQSDSRLLVFDRNTWTREYQELERCLDALKALAANGRPMIAKGISSSKAWWSIRERYLNARVVRKEVYMRRSHSGERIPAGLPRNQEIVARATILNGRSSMMLVRVWDSGVDPAVVDAAIGWIAREFRGAPACYSETAA